MNIFDVVHDAIQNGGGTYQLAGIHFGGLDEYTKVEHTFGYYASKPRGVENLPFLNGQVVESIVAQRHRDSGDYLGLWKDDHGNWSIDETVWFVHYSAAVEFAQRNNQRAIWDVEAGKELLIPLADWELKLLNR